ncbi:hypothetical protein THRCLA_20010 [Thraustotheca clavata]|uniref:Uncharacterized protein n=1 Tax=Thraustotheca clavata TaxID=74557 RepID=A0A1W0ACW0_9STRA|nr:hypothetical protein THRCLA_20010 [Thraustotheca clavata]
MSRQATIQIGEISCPVVESPMDRTPNTNLCILCGQGPFQPEALAIHFTNCFDSFCPIGRPNATPMAYNQSERRAKMASPPRHAYSYMNTFAGTRMPDIFSH